MRQKLSQRFFLLGKHTLESTQVLLETIVDFLLEDDFQPKHLEMRSVLVLLLLLLSHLLHDQIG